MLNLAVHMHTTVLYRVKGKKDKAKRGMLLQYKVVCPFLSEQDLEIQPL